MAQACPINFITVDNTVSRINSFITTVVIAAFLMTDQLFLLYLLGADLMIRLYGNKQFSPVHQTSTALKTFLRFPTRKVDSAAKLVAGHFGLLFILMLVASFHLGMLLAVDVIAAVYILCLLLDTFMNFCAGCKVYYLYRLISGEK